MMMTHKQNTNMEKKWIYLDDVRTPIVEHLEWVVVRNYDEFVSKIEEIGLENIETISLDHDLGPEAMREYFKNVAPNGVFNYNNVKEKTGLDCAKWLITETICSKIPLPQIFVHSANPIGSANIMGYVNNYLKNSKLPQTCVRVQIPHTANWDTDEIRKLQE